MQEPEFQVDVSERSTAIRYAPCTFRPRAQVDLPILRAITLDDDVDEPIDVEWSATATSHDGVAKGEFVLTPADNIRVPNYELVTKILGPADHDGYGDATE